MFWQPKGWDWPVTQPEAVIITKTNSQENLIIIIIIYAAESGLPFY